VKSAFGVVMKMSLRLRNYPIAKLRNSRSGGYILITLMLFLALLAIAALAVLPDIAFQVKRDREDELIHRAVAYSRGIRRYYKKFGRYPNRIEDLENANNLRFIRKRYKDPITNQDFSILRYGDPRLVGIMLNPGLQRAPGSAPTQPGSAPTPQPSSGTTGDSTNSPSGATNANTAVSSSGFSDASSSTQQVLGGGPMLGVASASTAQTIREFNRKNHYNDWLFIYDPASDRGGLLNAPYQPNLNPIIPTQVPGRVPSPGQPPGATPQPQNPPNPGNQVPPMQ
jgi:type II secretory pathway pseudopilin PulG